MIFLLGLLLAPTPEPQFAPGVAVPSVACQYSPGKSYALYLPSQYSPEKKWPLLICFDPRGRGMIPLELFREPAEELGFILASSNDFASDGPVEAAWEAILATWNDVTSRFPLDPGRIYATGFSGGARMAWTLAEYSPAPLAGIIGVGAGLPGERVRNSLDQFHLAFYGLSGTRDFNYYEMEDLTRLLDEASITHRFVVFDDRHNWPPEEFARRALEWMQVEAMRSGKVKGDSDFLRRVFESRLSWASQMEQESDFLGALAELRDLARQQKGQLELPQVAERLRRLEKSKDAARQLKSHERARREYDRARARLDLAFLPLHDTDLPRPQLNQLIIDSGLRDLRRAAADKDRERSLAAARTLEWALTDSSFYIARDLRRQGDYKRLQVSLQMALEILPDSGPLWFRLAGAYALDGETDKAFEALRTAVEKGVRDVSRIRESEDLASLRDDPRFEEIASRAGAGPPG